MNASVTATWNLDFLCSFSADCHAVAMRCASGFCPCGILSGLTLAIWARTVIVCHCGFLASPVVAW